MLKLMKDLKAKTRLIEGDRRLCSDRVSYAEITTDVKENTALCLTDYKITYSAHVNVTVKAGKSPNLTMAYRALFREIYGGLVFELEDLLMLVQSREFEKASERLQDLLKDLDQ